MTASNSSIAQTFKAGDKLAGCFVLKEMLPLGAVGVVWLAHDVELNKDVTLHFVPDSVTADQRAMSELKQEAKRNRQLIHPRIVRVYDLLEDEKWAAVSMDYVQGETLAAMQNKKAQRAFNPGEIAGWISELCQTLEDAHRVDLYHRDLAPENLLVTTSGLMVLKFGIARVILDSLARSGQKLEAARDIAFMSPQQLDGERPSREDDIYSMGAVVYDLLTGVSPYGSGDLVSNIRKTVPVRLSERRAALKIQGEPVPANWDKTVAACLEKTREARPNRASEAAAGFGTSSSSTPSFSTATAAVAATAATAIAAASLAEEKKEPAANTPPAPEKTPESTPDPEPSKQQLKKAWGPAKAPVITEATVLSKTSVPKGEKSESATGKGDMASKPAPATAGAADAAAAGSGGPERKVGGTNPTTPSGFPLRAFVDVDGEGKKGGGKPPMALLATGGVLALLLVIGYLVSRNSGSSTPPPPDGAAVAGTSSSDSDIHPVANEAVSPAPAASAPPAAHAPVNMVAANVPIAVAPAPVRPAPPIPAVAESTGSMTRAAVSGTGASNGEAPKNLDAARAALAAAEKDVQAKAAAQEQTAAAVKEAQSAIQAKKDAAASAKKAADTATAALQQQQAAAAKADADAADAQKQAAAKTQAADQLHKSLQDAQAGVKKQQTTQKQAEAEAAEMAAMVTQRQQQADAAAKAAADAEAKRKSQADAVQHMQADFAAEQMKAEQARQAAAAAQKAQEAARLQEQQRAAQEAARVQAQQRALEAQRLAAQASVAAKAAEDAEKALAAAKKAVEDAEKARAHAEQEAAAAAKGGALPVPLPVPASTPGVSVNMASPTPVALPAATPVKTTVAPSPASPTLTVHAPNLHSKVDATLGNSLGMRFAPVGNILFSVWLTRVSDFEAFAKATGFKPQAWVQPGFKQGPDHPVVNVSWNEAMQFCLWLTEKEHHDGILALNETYRLPTDMEWSKAVGLMEESGRTPESRDMDAPDVYPWGTQWPPPPGAGNYTGEETDSDVAIKGYNDGFAWTSPVGSFGANKFGLYDMGGNVWQWCLDWWNPEQKAKVLRGGSWYNGALKLSLLSSCRIHASAESETDNYGFRVVIANETTKAKTGRRH